MGRGCNRLNSEMPAGGGGGRSGSWAGVSTSWMQSGRDAAQASDLGLCKQALTGWTDLNKDRPGDNAWENLWQVTTEGPALFP